MLWRPWSRSPPVWPPPSFRDPGQAPWEKPISPVQKGPAHSLPPPVPRIKSICTSAALTCDWAGKTRWPGLSGQGLLQVLLSG